MKYIRTSAKDKHKEIDLEYKQLAKEYRQSGLKIEAKITEIEGLISKLPPKTPPSVKQNHDETLKLLRSMYRTVHEIGNEAGHYYERGWWRSEVYTLNNR